VLYEGAWQSLADGFSEHVRRCAVALQASGVPLHLRSLIPHRLGGVPSDDEQLLLDRMKYLTDAQVASYAVQIHQVTANASTFDALSRPHAASERISLPADAHKALRQRVKRKILYSVWERSDLIDGEEELLERFGEVWCACEENARMLTAAGVPHVRVVPIPHAPDDPMLELQGQRRIRGPVRFYTIGKWEPRKNHHQLVGAFLREFRPGEAELWVKTRPFGPTFRDGSYPGSIDASFTIWLEDPEVKAKGWTLDVVNRWVRPIKEIITQEKIIQLHRTCDIYVTASHGEGFDMPAYDSKLAGNLMVYTPSGGPQDFAGPEDEMVGSCRLERCHPFYGWMGCHWLAVDIDQLQLAMRRALRALSDRGGKKGSAPLHVRQLFTAEHVGRVMRSGIGAVLGRAGHVDEGADLNWSWDDFESRQRQLEEEQRRAAEEEAAGAMAQESEEGA
jgi:glycosyltransferase involved in cell wall biosynthesis